jgi:signal transduction histidine kinase
MFERLSERERIARELHDTFFQGIQGLLLTINTATQQLDPHEPARAIFTEALEQSDRVMLEGRDLVLDLRAVAKSNLDLPESLARSAEEFKHLGDAEFKVTVVGQTRTLNSNCAIELHRIGREALYNSFRHSSGSRIEVELHYEPTRLTLKIADNGIGIDNQVLRAGLRAGHWGLPGMQERARKIGAESRILSCKGGGTEIEVTVPASGAYMPTTDHLLSAWRARWVSSIRSLKGQTHD